MPQSPPKLDRKAIAHALDITRRRAYWREVGEVLLLAIYKPEGFYSLEDRATNEASRPLTLGEVIDRLPAEYQAKVLGIDAAWLIGILAPPLDPGTSPFGWDTASCQGSFRPRIELIQRPDEHPKNALPSPHDGRVTAHLSVEVEPPRIILPQDASPSSKKAVKRKAVKKKASKKKAVKKKAVKKKVAKRRPRRSLEQLTVEFRAVPELQTAPGLTRAAIRKLLTCSGQQINGLLEEASDLISLGEGRKTTYYFDDRQQSLPV